MPELAPQPCDLLIRNGLILTVDPGDRIIPGGAIAVQGNRILAVGPEDAVTAAHSPARTIDARGGIVHPGFIDGHTHTPVHCVRGFLTDDPREAAAKGTGVFTDWINAVTEPDEIAASRLAACELLMNGFTGVVEAATAFHPDLVAEAVSGVGIRVSVSDCMLWDVPGQGLSSLIPKAPCSRDRAMAGMGGQLWRNAQADGLVRGHVGLYGSGSASVELMAEALALAGENRAPFHQHQSFLPPEVAAETARYGRPPLVHFAESGVLGPWAVFTHMNVLTEAEVDAVVSSGMALVWQPGNPQYYGTLPRAPSHFPEMMRRGTEIAFGTDVAKVWSFGDLGAIAYLAAREWGDYIAPRDILHILTRGGARAMGMPEALGALEPGRRADIVIRDAGRPEAAPGADPELELVLTLRGKAVDTVICNGRVVLEDGRPLLADLEEVTARARRSGRDTAARAGF